MSHSVTLDKSVYPLEAVEKAAYRFIDRLTIVISQTDSEIVCEVSDLAGSSELDVAIVADFKREVLDQKLRKQIKDETEAARNLILAYAFSRSGLQG